jgi:hypothetical protein
MRYTDRQGRPELVMHPDIKAGHATYRVLSERRADHEEPAEPSRDDTPGRPRNG